LSESVAGVAASILGGLAAARHRLDAELVLASMFGMLGSSLPAEADDAERAAAGSLLLSGLISYCEQRASPTALGFLHLAHEQGPTASREQAGAAAQGLVDRGLTGPRWATSGSLSVLRAWRYGDVFGAQSSVGVLFTYGHREHAVCVLIDHELGGGIKDAWVAEGRDARGLRDRVATSMAEEPTAVFEDLTDQQALDALRSALACPPCPNESDQIEDVDSHLYLVHSRARQMAHLLGDPDVDLYADTVMNELLAEHPADCVRVDRQPPARL
jgi:hypothetical protein